MTDPNASQPTPPPAYNAPPPPATASNERPGRTLGIVAFVMSFFVQLVALILGIIAMVQSRKAGQKNGFALAAIIISAILMVLGVIVAVVLITAGLGAYDALCDGMAPGVYELQGGGEITCG